MLRDPTGAELAPFEQQLHERTVERLRERLGLEAYGAAVAAGARQPLEAV